MLGPGRIIDSVYHTEVVVLINTRRLSISILFLPSLDKYKHGSKEKLSCYSFSLFTCNLVIWKKLVRNQSSKWKVVFIRGVFRNLNRGGGLNFILFPRGAQHPLGPENPLKSLVQGGLAPIAPPECASGLHCTDIFVDNCTNHFLLLKAVENGDFIYISLTGNINVISKIVLFRVFWNRWTIPLNYFV